MARENKSSEWGQGYDYLFKDIWPNLDKIRQDNLNYTHDQANIEYCFSVMYTSLAVKAVELVKKEGWSEADKADILIKISNASELFKQARSINEKVIAINVAEQLLRAIY